MSRLLYYIALFLRRQFNFLLPFLSKYGKYLVFGFVLLLVAAGYRDFYLQYAHAPAKHHACAEEVASYTATYKWSKSLDQGWSVYDSEWFYNTTQGSALLPYDFFLVLRESESGHCLRSPEVMDEFRYIPQKASKLNPDGLPVGFVKEVYKGPKYKGHKPRRQEYVGFTCAACHTAQIDHKGASYLVDGGPAMADMVDFLRTLEASLKAAKDENLGKFTEEVLALENDYDTAEEVKADLEKWTSTIAHYNFINHSVKYSEREGGASKTVRYGNARLDAFGRIYNRVLEHVISRDQVRDALLQVVGPTKQPLLTPGQVDAVLKGINETIVGQAGFKKILNRLKDGKSPYPGLSDTNMGRVRNKLFNSPNAPVSYPFLWDVPQSDYVQWNGLASNAGAGPLGRNTGEVIGVFAILDWHVDTGLSAWMRRFSIPKLVTGQSEKKKAINFDSSADLFNLRRLERHLRSLKSPKWPKEKFGGFDPEKREHGRRLYAKFCQSCHEVIDRSDPERKIIAMMSSLRKAGTDPAMAKNSVKYTGKSGNFRGTYQSTDVGDILVKDDAPVIVILSAATTGVVTTPDPDKTWLLRFPEWLYTIGSAFLDNDIKKTIKRGNYDPDTTSKPFNSLLAYKARPLNGIWATAPYLHNGSVPTLYDLLLPVDAEEGEPSRPEVFYVGSREFDPKYVGFKSSEGPFKFDTSRPGNSNKGHVYGARNLSEEERMALLEYLKTL
ncbi:MAG: di-heme-cytochrome C peroxidase [Sphingomonadales bacterium]|nr:di-heme-cytochrome C peroxidase [Sphingomonadales bacterium]